MSECELAGKGFLGSDFFFRRPLGEEAVRGFGRTGRQLLTASELPRSVPLSRGLGVPVVAVLFHRRRVLVGRSVFFGRGDRVHNGATRATVGSGLSVTVAASKPVVSGPRATESV